MFAVIPQLLLLLHTAGQETPELKGPYLNEHQPLKKPTAEAFFVLFLPNRTWKLSNAVQTWQNVSSFSYYLRLLGKQSLLTGIKRWKNADVYKMQWTWAARREMPIRYCERHFLKKDGQTPEKFTQRSCGSSIPEANQNPAGSNPEKNLTSKLVLLSAGNWSRWPPDVPST